MSYVAARQYVAHANTWRHTHAQLFKSHTYCRRRKTPQIPATVCHICGTSDQANSQGQHLEKMGNKSPTVWHPQCPSCPYIQSQAGDAGLVNSIQTKWQSKHTCETHHHAIPSAQPFMIIKPLTQAPKSTCLGRCPLVCCSHAPSSSQHTSHLH
jgi:hypothetical protein